MTRNWAANGGSYVVAIVGLDGRVVAAATARLPSFMPWMPEVNVSGSSVYYMDGDQTLRQLSLDGSSRTIAVLPGGPDDRVVVAVEPGALRMAVGIAHLGPDTCPSPPIGPCYPPVSTTLRVERMDGTSVRELSLPRLPAAWHGGRVVVGGSGGYIQNEGQVMPFLAHSLALVNPLSGTVQDMSPTCSGQEDLLTGPLSAAGIACEHSSSRSLTAVSWDGSERILFQSLQPGSLPAILSPDGATAALPVGGSLDIAGSDGSRTLGLKAVPYGWLDATHILASTTALSASSEGFVIVETTSGKVVPVALGARNGFVPPSGAYFSPLPGLS